MTPERGVIAALVAGIAWLLYRDFAAESEYRSDRARWLKAMREYS